MRAVDSYPNRIGSRAAPGHIYYEKPSEATEAAAKAGYKPLANTYVHKEIVYYNKDTKKYISRDVGSRDGNGSHKGGVWKMADSVAALGSNKTRLGTYDADFKKIGD